MKKTVFMVLLLAALPGLSAREWFGYAIERMCNYDSLIDAAEKSFKEIAVTSRLPSTKKYTYKPENLRDHDRQSAWCTKGWEKDNYKIDFIVIKVPKGARGIRITNGYVKSRETFENNNRVKHIYLSFNVYNPRAHKDCEPQDSEYTVRLHTARDLIYLKDRKSSQEILFSRLERFEWSDFKQDHLYLGIGIVDIYPGKKWNDTCLSEVEVILNPEQERKLREKSPSSRPVFKGAQGGS